MARKRTAKQEQPRQRPGAGSPLASALADRIEASLLPGDTPFEPAALQEAAAFVLEAAMHREAGRSSLALASATEDRRFTRIAIVNDDMPFLVDSLAATIAGQGLAIDRLVHPVLPVTRTEEGALHAIGGEGGMRESMIYFETARIDARQRRDLESALRATLGDVRAAVQDWPKLQKAMQADAARIAGSDGAALLEWLNGGMLTQLGHAIHRRSGAVEARLGICRKSARELLAAGSLERAFAFFDDPANRHERVPLVIKANRIANVHRRVPLDLFIVPLVEDGAVSALSIHAGVWTSAALAATPTEVPLLRAHLARLMDRFGFDPAGHAGKALVHALTALPHDLLIGFSASDITRVATTMMSLVDRPRPRLAIVAAPLQRHLFAFVWLPRDLLSTQVRTRIEELLEANTGASLLDWSLQVEGGNLALLRFVLDIRTGGGVADEHAIELQLEQMLRGWGEAVEQELARDGDPGRAAAIANRYADAFPVAYRTAYGPAEAARDIARIRPLHLSEGAGAGGERLRDARFHRLPGDPSGRLRLKIYECRGALPLSDAVPALENFGFAVHSELPTELDDGRLGTIHDFTLSLADPAAADAALARAGVVEDAIAAVLNEAAEDDPFNRLVLAAGLGAEEANWLRAIYRYLRQAGMGFTIYTAVDALAGAPGVAAALVARLRAGHDPALGTDRSESRTAAIEAAESAIRSGLAKVGAINDDRLLRLYHAVIGAILRTNAFAPAGAEALAFKIDSARIPILPKPVPWREIFVYSRRVEGIHLRAGPVARGGLRWSDRRDDFRTEILGLMKAQRVKNAVIVPTGAKGGFYPKQLPNPALDREGWFAEGKASYQVFIRTLLSITDNIVGDKVVHPSGVHITDGEDPYFVVAADKGTATFSDVANALAAERQFWLDDAFASGGSNGYDHKAMGITAKGAWVSVQRHFLELGVDVQTDPVTVAGCGDMSGDVFGNGMLLSRAIRLVAAFDHRHIFIDPDPDPAASWAERRRMFDLPRSSWDDYDKALISKGGGVFPRSAKTIKLSAQARKLLGIEAKEIEPEALISAILAAPVDLLWFGGIGTYVKASAENHIQVGDPANDALRIDASQLRARVIGEGANLGVTQAARIEFALGGGRINTDFIDNSAGVDCSDNEVNIKIALAAARREGKLSEAKRSALLRDMTDAVAHLVLEDNRLQALALSVASSAGAAGTGSNLRLIEVLEDNGQLDRRTEGLADSETYRRRAADGFGLTRPELAVLVSSAKLALQDALEHSAVVDDPGLDGDLLAAFPEAMRGPYRKQILAHRLRREILATKIANRLVNRIGAIHPFELVEEEGATLAQIAAAFIAAERLFGLDEIWRRIETAAMPEGARIVLIRRTSSAVRSHMADLLRSGAGLVAPSALVADLAAGVGVLSDQLTTLLGQEARGHAHRMQLQLTDAGAPADVAALVVRLIELDGSVGLARLARDSGIAPDPLTRAFSEVGARLGLDWTQQTAATLHPSDPWERLLVAGLARDFQQMRLDFLRRLARRKGAHKDPFAAVVSWAEAHDQPIRQFRAMVARAQAQTPVAPAMLAQIASQARNLLGR